MFKVDWDELVAQVETHGPEKLIFILEDSATEEVLTFDGTDIKWDNLEKMIVVELSAI